MKRTAFSILVALAATTASADAVLPVDVAQRLDALRAHGDRFAAVIAQIEAEAAKPDWSFTGCGHEVDALVLVLPES